MKQNLSFFPRVFISWEAYNQMWAFVIECFHEISGFGEVEVGEGSVLIKKVFIVNQTCRESETDSETDATEGAADLLYEMTKKGGDPSKIKFWWHSHGEGEVFWSVKDWETIEGWDSGNVDFLVSAVLNRRLEWKLRIDVFHPLRIAIDNITLIVLPKTEGISLDSRKEILEKVKFIDERRESEGFGPDQTERAPPEAT